MPTGMNYLACTGMGGHYLCPTAIPSSLSPMANRQLPRERERERENAPPPLWTSSPPPWNHSPCPVRPPPWSSSPRCPVDHQHSGTTTTTKDRH
ncbi:Os09g0523450 [Oryza sativa Japonica Group]|uniref:Os09g0523450 protein n=1 Tax=Oryza sativa subsp. japonica TaxID=39947 RepID=A0A0P0XPG8_ORYSJ|nr:Os09g0523450 [Oryza sativa Japonica Group]